MPNERFDRTFGAYPMSIATSLAFEGITHTGEYIDRAQYGPAPILHMECIMVNLRTLLRNAINAFPSSDQMSLRSSMLAECCIEDYESIVELVRNYNSTCEVQLYVSTYKSINRDFKEVNFKKFDTVKQQILTRIEDEVVNRITSSRKDILKVFDYKLKGDKRSVIFTHHPIDLLSYYSFPELDLLESHTGIVKERKKWGTKLNVPKGCTTIPFNKPMLCIFGDKTYVNGQLPKVKKAVISVSEKCGWNALTTVSKQVADCKRMGEPHLAVFIDRYKA